MFDMYKAPTSSSNEENRSLVNEITGFIDLCVFLRTAPAYISAYFFVQGVIRGNDMPVIC